MGESVQTKIESGSYVSDEYSLQPVQLLSVNVVQESSQSEKSKLVCMQSSLVPIPPSEKAKYVLIREPLFKPSKGEKAVLVLNNMFRTYEMDENRIDPSNGENEEHRIDDMSTVINSNSIVSLLGSCTAFDEFEWINSGSISSALSEDDSVSKPCNNSEPFEALEIPTAYSFPSIGGPRESVLPKNSAKENATKSVKMPEELFEGSLSTDKDEKLLSPFSSQHGPPSSVDSELGVVELEQAGPGDYSRAVYVEHHPRRIGIPEEALCFLSVDKPSADYWKAVVMP